MPSADMLSQIIEAMFGLHVRLNLSHAKGMLFYVVHVQMEAVLFLLQDQLFKL